MGREESGRFTGRRQLCPMEPRAGNAAGLPGPQHQQLNGPWRPSSSLAIYHCGYRASHRAYLVFLLASLDQLPPRTRWPTSPRQHRGPPDEMSFPFVSTLAFLDVESRVQERENLIVPRVLVPPASLSAVAGEVGAFGTASSGGGGRVRTGSGRSPGSTYGDVTGCHL